MGKKDAKFPALHPVKDGSWVNLSLCMLQQLDVNQHNVWCSSETSCLHGFTLILTLNPEPVHSASTVLVTFHCTSVQNACSRWDSVYRTLGSIRRATTLCRPLKGNRSPSSLQVTSTSSSKR